MVESLELFKRLALGTWLSSGFGNSQLNVVLDDLKVLFQFKRFSDLLL